MNEVCRSEEYNPEWSGGDSGCVVTGMDAAKSKFLVHHNVAGTPATPKNSRAAYIVIFTCYTCRPLDTDNICVKAALDHIRHENLIKDDNPEDLRLIIRQVKVSTVMEVGTKITVLGDNREGGLEGNLTIEDILFDLSIAGYDVEKLYKTIRNVPTN